MQLNSIQTKEVNEVKKLILGVALASALSGCVQREIRYVEVPAQPTNLDTTKICEFDTMDDKGNFKEAGKVKLTIPANKTPAFITLYNGKEISISGSKWDAKYQQTLYYVMGNNIMGMASNCL